MAAKVGDVRHPRSTAQSSAEEAGGAVVRGRPRDAGIDARVLDATRLLLQTVGFEQTTIQSVARAAKVGASTIYRRWPSRIELIEEAVFPGFDEMTITPTGDVRQDLRRFLEAYSTAYTSPAWRAALPGLLAAFQSPQSARRRRPGFAANMRPHFLAMMAAAEPGSVDDNISPDDVLDLLIGAVMFKAWLEPLSDRAGAPDRTADLLDRVIAPREPVRPTSKRRTQAR
jgi:AcrR family transcriptional regulator